MMYKLMKLLFFVSIMYIALLGCAALEDKDVEGPKHYEAGETPSKIDKNNSSSFYGKYLVNDATVVSSSPDIAEFKGGLFLTLTEREELQYYYLLKHNGYNSNEESNEIKEENNIDFPAYNILADNLTIKLDSPIEVSDNISTYKIHSIKKISDKTIDMYDNITISDIDNNTASVCDPLQVGGDNCTSINGATKYIGAYRIEEIECSSNTYKGGEHFAGEMTAAPFLIMPAVDVDLSIAIKMQIDNDTLKQCVLGSQTNNILYENPKYFITAAEAVKGLSDVFKNVGLIGLETNDIAERTTMIEYHPKEQKDGRYEDKKYNNNTVKMKLRIMYNGQINSEAVKNLDGTTPYFSAN